MEKEFLPGETVVIAGELSPYLFLIKRGSVKLEREGETFFLSEDDFFGEEGCFFGKPALFSATAGEETLLQLMESAEASTGEPPKLWLSLSCGLHEVNPKANKPAAITLYITFFIFFLVFIC